ncbi:GntR family transcriptional regulator [Celeribacter sp.]|uniref:GntR family transcriptional regulator n=1 Tax=Celeribacter sp. TaxID=1890673 RepID=UPI003A912769
MTSNSQTVLSQLYEDIVVGTFSFGAKLGEEQLVERYGTKRHILRQAFSHLEELSFIERIPNRGVFVREPHPTEVTDLFEIRQLLETHAIKLMVLPAPEAIIEKMSEIQERHSEATRNAQYREVLHLNTEFHRVQYSHCSNAALAAAIEDYAMRTHPITAMKFGNPELMENVIEQHNNIIKAMAGTDHDALAEQIRAHFDLARIERYREQYDVRHGADSDSVNIRPRRRIVL